MTGYDSPLKFSRDVGLEDLADSESLPVHPASPLSGLLKERLREQLERQQRPAAVLLEYGLAGSLAKVVQLCMEDASVSQLQTQLDSAFDSLEALYNGVGLSRSERSTRLLGPTGVVLSPDQSITTIKDAPRLRSFIRGFIAAIKEYKKHNPGLCHIVYPACGPFAPLLIPVLSYFKIREDYLPSELTVTFVDVQPGVIKVLRALCEELDLGDYVREFACIDAIQYANDLPIDIVVLEAIQHGFSREGHLAIAKHFAKLLKEHGMLLPQHVKVRAALVDGQREFVEQWRTPGASAGDHQQLLSMIRSERIELGNVLSINLETLRTLNVLQIDDYTQMLECESIQIPSDIEKSKDNDSSPGCGRERILILYCELDVFKGEQLNQYESGITHPLPDFQVCINFTPAQRQAGDLLVQSGDWLKFFYRINGLPGFLPVRDESRGQNENGGIDE